MRRLHRSPDLGRGQVRDDEIAGLAVELDAVAPHFQFQRVRRRPAGLALAGGSRLALPRPARLLAAAGGLTVPAAPASARTAAGRLRLPLRVIGPVLPGGMPAPIVPWCHAAALPPLRRPHHGMYGRPGQALRAGAPDRIRWAVGDGRCFMLVTAAQSGLAPAWEPAGNPLEWPWTGPGGASNALRDRIAPAPQRPPAAQVTRSDDADGDIALWPARSGLVVVAAGARSVSTETDLRRRSGRGARRIGRVGASAGDSPAAS